MIFGNRAITGPPNDHVKTLKPHGYRLKQTLYRLKQAQYRLKQAMYRQCTGNVQSPGVGTDTFLTLSVCNRAVTASKNAQYRAGIESVRNFQKTRTGPVQALFQVVEGRYSPKTV